MLQINVESIAEVKVLDLGLSGRVRPVAAACRSRPSPRAAPTGSAARSTTSSATPTGTPTARRTSSNGDPKAGARSERDWGYSIGGPVGKPGGNNKLFFFYAQEFDRAPPAATSAASGCRPRSSGRATSRRRTDNNGNRVPVHQGSALAGRVHGGQQPAACFEDGGVLGRIPQNRLYRLGLNILNMYPLPNVNVPRRRPTTTRSPGRRDTLASSRPSASTTSRQQLRVTFKYSGMVASRRADRRGSIPGFNDTRRSTTGVVHRSRSTVNYTLTPTMFLEGTFGRSQNQLPAARWRRSAPADFCRTRSRSTTSPTRPTPAWAACRCSSRTPASSTRLLRLRGAAAASSPRIWDGTRDLHAAELSPGAAGSHRPTRRPTLPFPGYLNINPTHDVSISLTKVAGRHTFKTGFYNTHSFKARAAHSGSAFGTINFAQTTTATIRSTPAFGFANAALGCFSSLQPAVEVRRRARIVYNNTRRLRAGQLEGEQPADARLRRPLRAPAAAVRRAAARRRTSCLTSGRVGSAPLLYVAGARRRSPCSGSEPRQAMNP